ncbi:MAG TPA: dipicolinate synthase subunit B [Firmicutes bacterium]|jgi:dipicolinate synthase subunit B|nr:dipicolinate synthase subunit B [Bacillota bacterium]
MRFDGIRIGFAITGSHCTIAEVLPLMQLLKDEGAAITPILSPSVQSTDTRFGKAVDWHQKVATIAGKEPFTTMIQVEAIGPQKLLDLILIAPCTGNTLAKMAQGITDTCVLLAAKAHLRNNRSVVLAIATNDGLGANAKNIGTLINRKNIYLVPFGQDAPEAKQNSLVAKMNLIPEALLAALDGRQLQPVMVGY